MANYFHLFSAQCYLEVELLSTIQNRELFWCIFLKLKSEWDNFARSQTLLMNYFRVFPITMFWTTFQCGNKHCTADMTIVVTLSLRTNLKLKSIVILLSHSFEPSSVPINVATFWYVGVFHDCPYVFSLMGWMRLLGNQLWRPVIKACIVLRLFPGNFFSTRVVL